MQQDLIAIAKCLFSFPGSPARRRSRKNAKYQKRKTNTYIPERAWYQARYQASLLRHARSRAWGRCTKDPSKKPTHSTFQRLEGGAPLCKIYCTSQGAGSKLQCRAHGAQREAQTHAHHHKKEGRTDIPRSSSKHPGRQDKPGPSDS